ncbi:hypothetical protein ES711_04590 [Gelidibacter salicanalis]|uniref:Uncharacterized protein n=1 Tax=Gelidibacter salicanalis TaxID=291193 RepID=A0A5C7ART8_9FLAO|nr:hypothetical protein [Gelidibacter salicanalis]TXE09215.1 hypothetical protein ES711_04590 [Gelidibacter salicanalis]
MPYYNLEKRPPRDNGTYIVQVLTMQGYIRKAKAVWEDQKGFNVISAPLQANEFIKAWWQY